ncbi:hypothetical protein EI94DRAFT_1895775 [Lactarius quietus]|nr:hypothetical protein EI94DRAFT_1895775 [Lactarius quietus]
MRVKVRMGQMRYLYLRTKLRNLELGASFHDVLPHHSRAKDDILMDEPGRREIRVGAEDLAVNVLVVGRIPAQHLERVERKSDPQWSSMLLQVETVRKRATFRAEWRGMNWTCSSPKKSSEKPSLGWLWGAPKEYGTSTWCAPSGGACRGTSWDTSRY